MKTVFTAFCFAFALFPLVTRGDFDSFVDPGESLANADIRFVGENASDTAGIDVNFIGDVDGDGYEDLGICSEYSNDAGTGDGKVHIVFGGDILHSAGDMDLSSASVEILGEPSGGNGFFGDQVAPAGDVDGDGLDDVIIYAIFHNTSGVQGNGRAYLFLGKTLSSGSSFRAVDADHIFYNTVTTDNGNGYNAAGIGDIDGDGFDDLLIATPATDDVGRVNLFLGSSINSGGIYIPMDNADYRIRGPSYELESFGYDIDKLGDMDGDGLDDFMFSAPSDDLTFVFGGASVLASSSVNIDAADADVLLYDSGLGDGGRSLANAGDVDGDGLTDILVGTDSATTGKNRVYLVSGATLLAAWSTTFDLADSDMIFDAEGADGISAVDGAGDVDGDGWEDVLIGVSENDESASNAGKAYVVTSTEIASNTSSSFDLADADYQFTGEAASDWAGAAVAGAGDVDNDGDPEIIIGAYGNDDGGSSAGKAYLIFTDRDCTPTTAVYVDGLLGSDGAGGGVDCPLRKIQDGIDLADSLSMTQVVVQGWYYPEAIQLAEDVQVMGQLRYFGTNGLPPYIINTNYSGYTVKGANRAALKFCAVIASYYTGGIELNAVNEMTLQENIIYVSDSGFAIANTNEALYLHNGCVGNEVYNNVFYSRQQGSTPATVHLGQNSTYNEFINNTMHRLYTTKNLVMGQTGMVVRLEQYTEDNEFRNNILHSTLATSVSATTTVTYTSWYGFYADSSAYPSTYVYNKTSANNYNVTLGAGCVTSGNPWFTSPAPYGFDYHIATNSVCRNRGTLGAAYYDPDGTRNDMGAYGGPDSLNFAP